MNYSKIFKRETKIIAYVVICLTLVVMGVSYALFLQVNNNNANQVVNAGSLEITYDNGNVVTVSEDSINNCLMPQSDANGMGAGGCEYLLSIYNSGTLPMQYDLLIYDDLLPSGGSPVDHRYIRHSLNKQYTIADKTETVTAEENRALSSLALKDETKRIMEHSVIAPQETITFTLKIWIDENAPGNTISNGQEVIPEDSIVGKYVYLKLDVSGIVYEDEAATTTLLSNREGSGLVEATGASTFAQNGIQEYRFTGNNPNNYVYFNCSDDTQLNTCEKWRMLGIYNTSYGQNAESKIKIIKYASDEVKSWDENSKTDYESASLNTYLSTIFYDSLSTTARGQIDNEIYYLSGSSDFTLNGGAILDRELNSENKVSAPVGIMSVSDYMFASGVNEGDTLNTLINRNESNWLFTGKAEWLINKNSEEVIYAISTDGSLSTSATSEEKLIRPVVYLDSNIKIIGGDGTEGNPYVLSK